jgi:penicillin-binding protein 1A
MQQGGTITAAIARSAKDAPVVLQDRLRRQEPYGLYFKEQVRQALVQQFGWARVYQGGLRVHTTIDLAMQRAAEDAVRQSIAEIEAQRKRSPRAPQADPSNPLQGALVAIDVPTGEVRSMVGGRDFEQSRFNRAVQARRQPGSAFKPFVFAAAIESGYTPASIIDRLDEPVMTLQGEWTPEDEHTTATAMTLRSALRVSSNRAAVRLLENVGIDRTVSYAKALGVGSQPSVPSLALGSGEVTPLALTAAFSAFANRGLLNEPILIRRVEAQDGTLLYQSRLSPQRVLSESTAFLLTSMLADVINHGTAWKARRLGFVLPAAGKTGTTNDYLDAWFVGFTPALVTGVWLGFDQPRTIISNGYAADLAVPLWARFMKTATKGHKPDWYVPPRGIVGVNVCRMSGRLPADGCTAVDVVRNDGTVDTRSMVYTEYFVRGTQPNDACPLHPETSFFDRIAGLFGRETEPAPPDPTAVPPTATDAPQAPAVEEAPSPSADPPAPPKKKRGFWAKVFGIGKDNEQERNKRSDRERR